MDVVSSLREKPKFQVFKNTDLLPVKGFFGQNIQRGYNELAM
jgi:hypothetical protein